MTGRLIPSVSHHTIKPSVLKNVLSCRCFSLASADSQLLDSIRAPPVDLLSDDERMMRDSGEIITNMHIYFSQCYNALLQYVLGLNLLRIVTRRSLSLVSQSGAAYSSSHLAPLAS